MLDDRDDTWKPRAACRGEDTSLFYPPDSSSDSRRRTEKAKAICAGCVVQVECREYGWRELFGTWGGMSQRERLLARREEFRRGKAWSIALTLVLSDVPDARYDDDER